MPSKNKTLAPMKEALLSDYGSDIDSWLEFIPVDVDDLARRTGAIKRRRVITKGVQVLRLLLVYVACWRSLRTTAVWAAKAMGICLTEGALRHRFRQAEGLVKQLVESLLSVERSEQRQQRRQLQIIDGTILCRPGATGTEWRLHLTYEPVRQVITGIELTDHKQGEWLDRVAGDPLSLSLGDRGYGHARDFRAARDNKLDCLVRVHLMNLPVDNARGERIKPRQLTRAANRGVFDHEVWVSQKGYESVAVRLIVVPLPKHIAAEARRKLRKAAKKKGKKADPLAIHLAGYLFLATTLSVERATARHLCLWYRIRWQIELLFKRGRSLMGLGQIEGGESLVRVQLWSQLLLALLVQRRCSTELLPNEGSAQWVTPPSIWRVTALVFNELVFELLKPTESEFTEAHRQAIGRNLRERGRRRRKHSSEILEEMMDRLSQPYQLELFA